MTTLNTNPPLPIAATISNVTRQTGLSRSEIYRLLARGKLKAVKSGRSTLVLMDTVIAHFASLPEATFRPPVE
jgi:excisionase family DNA binding protein